MRRGDLVAVALPGDYGKPRPALVVQSDVFMGYLSITVLPLTSDLMDAEFFRSDVPPTPQNNLRIASQVMVDKLNTLPVGKIGKGIGRLDAQTLERVDRALLAWLDLPKPE